MSDIRYSIKCEDASALAVKYTTLPAALKVPDAVLLGKLNLPVMIPSAFRINPDEVSTSMAPLPADRQMKLEQALIDCLFASAFAGSFTDLTELTSRSYSYGHELCDICRVVDKNIVQSDSSLTTKLSAFFDALHVSDRLESGRRVVTFDVRPNDHSELTNLRLRSTSSNTLSNAGQDTVDDLWSMVVGFAGTLAGPGNASAADRLRTLVTTTSAAISMGVSVAISLASGVPVVVEFITVGGVTLTSAGMADSADVASHFSPISPELLTVVNIRTGNFSYLTNATPTLSGTSSSVINLLRLDAAARKKGKTLPDTSSRVKSKFTKERLELGDGVTATVVPWKAAFITGAPSDIQPLYSSEMRRHRASISCAADAASYESVSGAQLNNYVVYCRKTGGISVPATLFGYEPADVTVDSAMYSPISYGTGVSVLPYIVFDPDGELVGSACLYQGKYVTDYADYLAFVKLVTVVVDIIDDASDVASADVAPTTPAPSFWDQVWAFFKANFIWIIIVVLCLFFIIRATSSEDNSGQ